MVYKDKNVVIKACKMKSGDLIFVKQKENQVPGMMDGHERAMVTHEQGAATGAILQFYMTDSGVFDVQEFMIELQLNDQMSQIFFEIMSAKDDQETPHPKGLLILSTQKTKHDDDNVPKLPKEKMDKAAINVRCRQWIEWCGYQHEPLIKS